MNDVHSVPFGLVPSDGGLYCLLLGGVQTTTRVVGEYHCERCSRVTTWSVVSRCRTHFLRGLTRLEATYLKGYSLDGLLIKGFNTTAAITAFCTNH